MGAYLPEWLFKSNLFDPICLSFSFWTGCICSGLSSQTISQPYIVAKMTELLYLKPTHKVLEIGTGTGYQTAILAELASEVYTMEVIKSLSDQAQENLAPYHYDNIHFICGNGYHGYPKAAPYDAIIVTAAPPHVPDKLIEQLAPEGRMVIPVGSSYQILYLITKNEEGVVTEDPVFSVVFVPMVR